MRMGRMTPASPVPAWEALTVGRSCARKMTDTYPHNPECQPFPSYEPLIHVHDARRIAHGPTNGIDDSLGGHQMRSGGGEGAQTQSETHEDQTGSCEISPRPRPSQHNCKDDGKINVHDSHGAGTDDGNVSGAFEGCVGAVVILEDSEGERET